MIEIVFLTENSYILWKRNMRRIEQNMVANMGIIRKMHTLRITNFKLTNFEKVLNNQIWGDLRRKFQIMLLLEEIGGVLRILFKTEENWGVLKEVWQLWKKEEIRQKYI